MFFILSKLFWLFFAPSHLALWVTIAGVTLLFLKRERAGRWCTATGAALFVAFGYLPTGFWLMRPIENRYPHPPLPAHVDGILVLGGGLSANVLVSRGEIGMPESESRLVGAFELSRRYPEARVVFSGGTPDAMAIPETVAAQHVFDQMGLAPNRLTLENRSRNTWENFVFTKALVKPNPGEVWILCTSADHLPRAMGIARRVGWKMIPWATDYMTLRHGLTISSAFVDNLKRTDMAAHEWYGLLGYALNGRSAPAGD